MQLSRSDSGAMAAPSAANHPWSESSSSPGLLLLGHPSQEFRSPADNDNGVVDASADATTRRRSSATGWRAEPRETASEETAVGRSAAQGSLSGEAEAALVARTGRDAAADAGVAARTGPQLGLSLPSPRGSSPAWPSVRPRPLVSTPMPETGSAPLFSRRPRRDVARPVSYEEPSLHAKMRK